ncbi:hypothetical protein BB561_006627 [Smittium simulii]|uniref:RNA polymerase II subunit A C-terminal domain phosphatase n=1 Tax=Smittium simulii TaxID=133385 RepID=A0A2T9Y2U6_9FUNG|nr:hypothetical protein BB561_006627 [Smittium simulii]
MEKSREIFLSHDLLPATITRLKVYEGQTVSKGDLLFYYEHSLPVESSQVSDPRSATITTDEILQSAFKNIPDFANRNKDIVRRIFYSNYDGKIEKIFKHDNEKILLPTDKILLITEPCGHEVQFNGLCSICGKDVTFSGYHGSDLERATVNMSHDVVGLMVSNDEALRLEIQTSTRLFAQKKLSLILDLDQTLMHAYASDDSGFESWLANNYDYSQAAQADASFLKSSTSSGSDAAQPDASILNSSVSDATPASPPTVEYTPRNPTLRKICADLGVFFLPPSPLKYYIKMRPGLLQFLKLASEIFELHIYTMGTREYAEAVAELIDPTNHYFKERILSRDESGSMTHKSIRRLFPCDDSMVIVLDDRADVWNWSPNLIKVKKYAFFAGVGDINAPPIDSISLPSTLPVSKVEALTQEHLTHHSTKLVDDDRELEHIFKTLKIVHSKFYALNKSVPTFNHFSRFSSSIPKSIPVSKILTKNKLAVLRGANIVFSAVIPRYNGAAYPFSQIPENSDIWLWASQFGAEISHEISFKTTHIVSNKLDTAKVNQARFIAKNALLSISTKSPAIQNNANDTSLEQNPNSDNITLNTTRGNAEPIGDIQTENSKISNIDYPLVPVVVSLDWLLDSISAWSWLPEKDYLLYPQDHNNIYFKYPQEVIKSNLKLQTDQYDDQDFDSTDSNPNTYNNRGIGRVTDYDEFEDPDQQNLQSVFAGEGHDRNSELIDPEIDVSELVNHVDWDDVDRELNEVLSDSEFDEFDSNEEVYDHNESPTAHTSNTSAELAKNTTRANNPNNSSSIKHVYDSDPSDTDSISNNSENLSVLQQMLGDFHKEQSATTANNNTKSENVENLPKRRKLSNDSFSFTQADNTPKKSSLKVESNNHTFNDSNHERSTFEDSDDSSVGSNNSPRSPTRLADRQDSLNSSSSKDSDVAPSLNSEYSSDDDEFDDFDNISSDFCSAGLGKLAGISKLNFVFMYKKIKWLQN